MEEGKLQELFAEFAPDMVSDDGFMAQLRHNMQAVELVKQHNCEAHSRNKRAIGIAAIAGIIMGIMLALCFPGIEKWLHFKADLLLWILTAIVSAMTAVNAYDIAIARLTASKSPH